MRNKYSFWEKYFPFIITSIFLTLGIILITRHEFWFDEINAWNRGYESLSISEFVATMKDSEGHPFLWNLILYFISHFITTNIESMKVIHLAISTVSCFLFLKYAPFGQIVKILFVFGYFPFYEYSIISRNYAIGILPIIIFCILYKNKYKNIILISITLFFMGQANIYTFIISMVFSFMIVIEFIIDHKIVKKNINKVHLIIASSVILAEILSIYWQLGSQAINGSVFGPSVYAVFNKSFDQYKASVYHVSRGIISAFIPIPQITLKFWRTNLVTAFLSKFRFLYTFLFSLVLMIIPIFTLKRRVIFFYIIGSISVLTIPFFVYVGSLRHFGHLFLLLIAFLWISSMDNTKGQYLIRFKDRYNRIILSSFLIIVLLPSLAGSSIATYFDYRYPFSSGKQVAEYIENNYDKDKIIIVGYKDVDASTVATYLNKDIYFPQAEQFGRVCPWGKRIFDLDADEIFRQAIFFIHKSNKILVVIHGNAIKDPKTPERYLFKKIDVKFDNSIVGYEKFYLYLFNRSENYPILDFNAYRDGEFQNSRLSTNNKEIIFEGDKNKLKLCEIPIVIKNNKDYLISFEIKRASSLDNVIYFDFFGESYDNPKQEFNLKLDEVGIEFKQVNKVLNSGNIPLNSNIYFRIFTWASGGFVIRNLEIYEIDYDV